MYVEVNLDEVDHFINSPDFHSYLLANVKEFNTAAWILETLLRGFNEATSVDNQE